MKSLELMLAHCKVCPALVRWKGKSRQHSETGPKTDVVGLGRKTKTGLIGVDEVLLAGVF